MKFQRKKIPHHIIWLIQWVMLKISKELTCIKEFGNKTSQSDNDLCWTNCPTLSFVNGTDEDSYGSVWLTLKPVTPNI